MYKFSDVPRGNDSRYFVTANGDFIAPLTLEYFNYLAKVNMEDLTYIPFQDREEYENSNLPTINDLMEKGLIFDKTYCVTIDLDIEEFHDCWSAHDKKLDIDMVLKYFENEGHPIDREAVEHNYCAWRHDLKSGYRGKDYHLFTPYGCNILSFRLTTLDSHFDWQETYEC